MDAETISKNEASLKSHITSNENKVLLQDQNMGGMVFLFFIVLLFVGALLLQKKIRGKPKKISAFEARMRNCGYTKHVVVYDFISGVTKWKVDLSGDQYEWTVGIWLNYQKQLVALRPEKNTWKEIVVPFDKIRRVEVIENGYSKTNFSAVGYGAVTIGSATTKEFNRGLQIRIVVGDFSTGTQSYFLKLWDPIFGHKFNKSDPHYKSIEECARSIVDEFKNIIQYSQTTKPEKEERLIEKDKKQCPYCGEEILATAKKCKHCSEWLDSK
jgi:hypothetical protein